MLAVGVDAVVQWSATRERKENMSASSKCEACGAPIVWRPSESTGKRAPINAEPDPNGNIMVVRQTGAYRVLTKAMLAEMEGSLFEKATRNDRYTNHFATCPQADKFKSRGRSSSSVIAGRQND